MKKKKSRTRSRLSALGLPKGWTLPALADRRKKPRPKSETPRAHDRAAAKRKKK